MIPGRPPGPQPRLHSGSYRLLGVRGETLTYERSWGGKRVVVALNLGDEDGEAALDGVRG